MLAGKEGDGDRTLRPHGAGHGVMAWWGHQGPLLRKCALPSRSQGPSRGMGGAGQQGEVKAAPQCEVLMGERRAVP